MPDSEPTPSRFEAALLKTLLAERDIPCPVCGYNLHACQSSACPECGAKLDLRVGSTDLKMGLWLAALLGVAIPLGLSGTASVIAVIAALEGEFVGSHDWTVGWLCWGTVLMQAGLLSLVIWKRRLFWRKRRAHRLLWMIMILATSIAFTVAFVWSFLYLIMRF